MVSSHARSVDLLIGWNRRNDRWWSERCSCAQV